MVISGFAPSPGKYLYLLVAFVVRPDKSWIRNVSCKRTCSLGFLFDKYYTLVDNLLSFLRLAKKFNKNSKAILIHNIKILIMAMALLTADMLTGFSSVSFTFPLFQNLRKFHKPIGDQVDSVSNLYWLFWFHLK